MERELAVVVDYRMSRIGAALETHDHIRLSSEHIGNFTFTLVAPVGTHNCSDHT